MYIEGLLFFGGFFWTYAAVYRPVAFKAGENPIPKDAEGKVELAPVDYVDTYAVSGMLYNL
jgi:hypothetical protein